MAVADVRIVPVGHPSTSFSQAVAQAYRVAKASGLRHELTPTATVLEGDLGRILETARRMHEACLGAYAQRVVTTITVDDRRDAPTAMGHMVASVMEEISRELV
jgi:uncharacterized protein (TIGR00106 family)